MELFVTEIMTHGAAYEKRDDMTLKKILRDEGFDDVAPALQEFREPAAHLRGDLVADMDELADMGIEPGTGMASLTPSPLRIVEEDLRRVPSKGWAALIRKPNGGLRNAALMAAEERGSYFMD